MRPTGSTATESSPGSGRVMVSSPSPTSAMSTSLRWTWSGTLRRTLRPPIGSDLDPFASTTSNPVNGGMQPPPFPDVPHQIAEWLEEVALIREAEPLRFPEALARVHARFEQIHPFLDGNGRAGRLVLNLLLGRLGYPPAIIYKRERTQYLNALRRADGGDHGALGELLARAVLHNLHKFVVPAIAGPARLVPLPALADDVLSADALRVAAARGRLEASKGADGTWRSSRAWVDAYKASRRRRRG
jgi:fido (protein-threonine AMPylation protein)